MRPVAEQVLTVAQMRAAEEALIAGGETVDSLMQTAGKGAAEWAWRVAAGRPVTVWGIRARNAPVITMLAYAPNAETSPTLVERLYWRLGGRGAAEQAASMRVAGVVKAPLFAPQGEVVGAILEDFTVVVLPQGTINETLREMLKPGARVVVEGPGVASDLGRALVAERIGENVADKTPSLPGRPALWPSDHAGVSTSLRF